MQELIGTDVSLTLLVVSRPNSRWSPSSLPLPVSPFPFSAPITPTEFTDVAINLDAMLALCALALADKVPRIANAQMQTFAVLAWGGFMIVGYSMLISIFRIKNGGYPFALPPFL